MSDKKRKILKKLLVGISIFLGVIWLMLFLYGIRERSASIEKEIHLGQIREFNIKTPIAMQPEAARRIAHIAELESPKNTVESIAPPAPTTPNPVPPTVQVPLVAEKQKPKIALIVTNLGTNKYLTDQALALSKNITLGFLPYTNELKNLLNAAVDKGHEIFLYLPFETVEYPNNDPGPYAILAKNNVQQNADIINNILNLFPNMKGVYGSFRENLSGIQEEFEPIIQQIKARNLSVLLGKTYIEGVPQYFSNYNNILITNILIDETPKAEGIKANLDKLVEHAKVHNYAIGYINTYPITLSILGEWLTKLNSEEVELVSVSEILKAR